MIIKLTDKFSSSELELGEKCTYIFGKNGTGTTSIADMIKNQIIDNDVRVFKNFDEILSEDKKLNAVILGEENNEINKQIKKLERTVSGYFDYVEDLIENENTFTMEEFANSVNEFLAFRKYNILEGKGKISKKQADEKVTIEYNEFNKTQKIESDFNKMTKNLLRKGQEDE